MTAITAPNVPAGSTLAFGLIGATPAGDTFVEPTVLVTPTSAGNVALQPSAQGTAPGEGEPVPFTTAGVFTPAANFAGPVTLSAEVQGIDDQDATFSVLPPPETTAFDPAGFSVVAGEAPTQAAKPAA